MYICKIDLVANTKLPNMCLLIQTYESTGPVNALSFEDYSISNFTSNIPVNA